MKKCPACGYQDKRIHNIGKNINKILKSRSKSTIRMLNKIAPLITSNIPSEDRYRYYQFLYGTKDVEDNVMEWAIETYYQSNYMNYGKGFAYLRTIALTRGKNIKRIQKNERDRLGSVPPVYKGEEEEW